MQHPAERPRRFGERTEDVGGHRPARETSPIRVTPVDGRGLPVGVPIGRAFRRTDPHAGQRASVGGLGLVAHLGLPATIGECHPQVVQGAPTAQEHAVAPLVGEGQAACAVDVEVEVVGPSTHRHGCALCSEGARRDIATASRIAVRTASVVGVVIAGHLRRGRSQSWAATRRRFDAGAGVALLDCVGDPGEGATGLPTRLVVKDSGPGRGPRAASRAERRADAVPRRGRRAPRPR